KMTSQETIDDTPMNLDVPPSGNKIWGILEYTCEYSGGMQKNIPNDEITKIFYKQCAEGQTGSGVPYTVDAGEYLGYTLAEANLLALQEINNNGQNNANLNGTCS